MGVVESEEGEVCLMVDMNMEVAKTIYGGCGGGSIDRTGGGGHWTLMEVDMMVMRM